MRVRGVGRMVLAVAVALGLIAPAVAQQTLNPVVTVLPKATTPVPDECEKGLTESPAAPRVTPEEKKAAIPAPPPPPPAPPPAPTLRGAFAELENAAERGDRDAFRAALARARETVANYPAGGEKNAAMRALEVYEDIGALIDYQNDARIGAFFDASSGDLLARMKKYPDYQRSISDLTIVDATGTRFYPTRETREFLIREAASRLRGVPPSTAVKTPAPSTPTPVPSTKPPKPAPKVTEKPHVPKKAPAVKKPSHVTPAPKTAHAAPKKKPAPVPSTKHATSPRPAVKKPVAKPVTKVAEAKPPVKVTEKPAPAPVTKPAPKPAPTPVTPTPPTTTTTAAPVPTQTATTAPPTTATATTTTMTTSTTSSEPATTTTASTTSAAPEKPEKPGESRRSLLLPIILIVLGVGVLIMLFRTSR